MAVTAPGVFRSHRGGSTSAAAPVPPGPMGPGRVTKVPEGADGMRLIVPAVHAGSARPLIAVQRRRSFWLEANANPAPPARVPLPAVPPAPAASAAEVRSSVHPDVPATWTTRG